MPPITRIDADSDSKQLNTHLDGDPAGEVLVAVEEAGRTVQRVAGIVNSRTFLQIK